MKIKRENFGWLFTVVLLALLLALSIYLGISGWYFKTEVSYTTDLKLGKTLQMGVDKNSANSISFNLEGSFLAGDKLPQIISIKNMDDEKSVYLRAKIFIYSSGNQTLKMDLDETVNWSYNEGDGYYYFNDLLTMQNKVALCSHIMINEATHLQTNTKYIVTVLAEAVEENQDIEALWGNNPIKSV